MRKTLGFLALLTTAGFILAGAGSASAAEQSFKWLCKPGKADNPCLVPPAQTSTTSVGLDGVSTQVPPPPPMLDNRPKPKVDCFYVYPTISTQTGPNAELIREPAVDQFAAEQIGLFGSRCRIFAPLYRQFTVPAIFNGQMTPEVIAKAYAGVKAAWNEYLKKYNKGRGVILIGHSQGTGHLGNLIEQTFDQKPKLRKRLVSALLIGGNIWVPKGKKVGGQFKHVPACSKRGQTGCAVAYSGFLGEPPEVSLFGRINGALIEPGLDPEQQEIMCVNPANLAGGYGTLSPFKRTDEVNGETTDPFGSAWVTYPDMYRASCQRADGAHWLQVDLIHSDDPRPRIAETLGRPWGTHLTELNDAAGNLVSVATAQSYAYDKKVRAVKRKAGRRPR